MKRPSNHLVTAGFGTVAGTGALLALTIGTGPAMPVSLLVAVVAGAIALSSWNAGQPIRADSFAARVWWKLVLAGPVMAALTFAAMAVPWPAAIDLGENAYWLVVIAFMTSLTLAAAGLLLGASALVEHRRGRPLGSPA